MIEHKNPDKSPDIQLHSTLPDIPHLVQVVPNTTYQVSRLDPSAERQNNFGKSLPIKGQFPKNNLKGQSGEIKKKEAPSPHIHPDRNHLQIEDFGLQESTMQETTPAEMAQFNDENETIRLAPDYDAPVDLTQDLLEPQGLEIPENLLKTPEEIVQLDKYEEPVRGYIKDIFIDSYPNILARSALDRGFLSRTMGTYTIKIKPGESLPKQNKIYFLSPVETSHLRELLSFLIKQGVLMRTPVDEKQQYLTGSPCYLIPRSREGSAARLICDFTNINHLIVKESPVIADVTHILHSLRKSGIYSKTDLSNAYNSVTINPESRWITNCLSPLFSFSWKSLPTGLANSPEIFARIANRMLHNEIVRDDKGEPIFEAPNIVKLEESHIDGAEIFYDDILMHSPVEITYERTLKSHFALVKKVMGRLSAHSAKISFEKSQFAASKIQFLGWNIRAGFLMADPKRIEKMRNAEFPQTASGVRSFLGILNSLSSNLGFPILAEARILSPLTSVRAKFEVTEAQRQAFERLKIKLTEKPIFSKLIHPNAEKILFTDASSSHTGSYSAVLAQVIKREESETFVPDHLCLESKVDQLIYDHKLTCRSAPILTTEDEYKNYRVAYRQSHPPEDAYLSSPLLGYTEDNVADSLFISTRSLQLIFRCKLMSSLEMRELIAKHIQKSVYRLKLCDFVYNNDKLKYKEYIHNFRTSTQCPPDPLLYTVEAMAVAMFRPIIVISTLESHRDFPIRKFNTETTKPPFIFGLYQVGQHLIYRPYFIDRETYYNLAQHRGEFEIVAYHTRSLPPNHVNQPIVQHELYAILSSLHSFQKLVGHSKVTLLCDNKALYMLYNSDVHRSSVRLWRYSKKLKVDYPRLRLEFIPTHLNVSDFLSKRFRLKASEAPRLGLPRFAVSDDLIKDIPVSQSFTVSEWEQFVQENPNYLSIKPETPTFRNLTASLGRMIRNLEEHMRPVSALASRISHENIIKHQRQTEPQLYETCLTSKDFIYLTSENDVPSTYKLSNGLLLKVTDHGARILLPKTLTGLFLAYHHLTGGHAGLRKMVAVMEPYYFPSKLKAITQFVASCYTCQLQNQGVKGNKLGAYPCFEYPFQAINLDLAENLTKSHRYEHILLVSDPVTDYLLTFPIRNKSAEAVSHILIYSVFSLFRVSMILSDNGACFSDRSQIKLWSALGIRKVLTSSLSPKSRGAIESRVKSLKELVRKLMANQELTDWRAAVFLATKMFNHTPSNKTGFKPVDLLFGSASPNAEFFFSGTLPKLHPLVENQKTQIQDMNKEIATMIEQARDEIQKNVENRNAKLNKTRIIREFKNGDIVFIKNKTYTPGVNPALRTRFSASPFMIVQTYPVSCLVQRLSDGFRTLYHHDMLKLYKPISAEFSHLPTEVLSILKRDHATLNKTDFETLRRFDPFDSAMGDTLYEIQDEQQVDDLLHEINERSATMTEDPQMRQNATISTGEENDTVLNNTSTIDENLPDTSPQSQTGHLDTPQTNQNTPNIWIEDTIDIPTTTGLINPVDIADPTSESANNPPKLPTHTAEEEPSVQPYSVNQTSPSAATPVRARKLLNDLSKPENDEPHLSSSDSSDSEDGFVHQRLRSGRKVHFQPV